MDRSSPRPAASLAPVGGVKASSSGCGSHRASFVIGVGLALAAALFVALVSRAQAGPPARAASGPGKTFHSAPNLHPTVVNMSSDPDTASGDIFISPDHTSQNGPMILNSQ